MDKLGWLTVCPPLELHRFPKKPWTAVKASSWKAMLHSELEGICWPCFAAARRLNRESGRIAPKRKQALEPPGLDEAGRSSWPKILCRVGANKTGMTHRRARQLSSYHKNRSFIHKDRKSMLREEAAQLRLPQAIDQAIISRSNLATTSHQTFQSFKATTCQAGGFPHQLFPISESQQHAVGVCHHLAQI